MANILDNIRVLDLTRVLAGPWCTQVLADMGAEVIKIESPQGGDEARSFPPHYPGTELPSTTSGASAQGMSGFFACCNRGKKSVVVDIRSAGGQASIRELAKNSDVVVENFKAGNLARYGLDYASLSASNPALVYCSITGYGQTGPLSAYPGYDLLFQGLSGAMSTCGLPDDQPGGGPMRTLVPHTDVLTGMYACTGILAALLHRRATGEGQYIDLALLDVAVAGNAYIAGNYLASGHPQGRVGNSGIAAAPSGVYPCSDGFVIIQSNARHWPVLCSVLQREAWLSDPRFATLADRLKNGAQLDALVAEITLRRPKAEWVSRIAGAGVPCAVVNTIAEAFDEPQVIHRQLVQELHLSDAGSIRVVANPLRFSKTPLQARPPPRLGADTEAILHRFLSPDRTVSGAHPDPQECPP